MNPIPYILLLFINGTFIDPAIPDLMFEECRTKRNDILFDYARLEANVMCFGKVVVFCRAE